MTYNSLNEQLYTKCSPKKFENPQMQIHNLRLASDLGLEVLNEPILGLIKIFSGQKLFDDTSQIPEFDPWYKKILERQMNSYSNQNEIEKSMKASNPAFIPRNNLVEEALFDATEKYSMDKFNKLLLLLENPFDYIKEQLTYKQVSTKFDKKYKTYCGT